VSLILGANHVSKIRPGLKGGQAGVSRDEAMPIADECQQFFLLLRSDIDFPVAQEEDAVDITQAGSPTGRTPICLECSVRDNVGLRSNIRTPETGLITEPLHDGERMRRKIMQSDSVSGIGPGKQYLPLTRAATSTAAAALR